MPRDFTGRELKLGDRVLIPAVVTERAEGETHANVTVQVEHLPHGGEFRPKVLLNSRQVVQGHLPGDGG